MNGLQTAFYIIAIIYMAFMFLVTVVALVALGMVAGKLKRAQRKIQRKIRLARDASQNVLSLIRALRYIVRT